MFGKKPAFYKKKLNFAFSVYLSVIYKVNQMSERGKAWDKCKPKLQIGVDEFEISWYVIQIFTPFWRARYM